MATYLPCITREKNVILKVGRTYLTRDGQRVLIEAETTRHGTYNMQGIYLKGADWHNRCNEPTLGVIGASRTVVCPAPGIGSI
jgi:hypothetical protein